MELREFEEILNDAEVRLDRLRALYEQYFQGIERLEPAIPKKELERRIALLRKAQPRNTALRFRYQRLIQRLTTYQNYWRRIARQIEEGTHRRDLRRARERRGRDLEGGDAAEKVYEIDIDIDLDDNLFGADDVAVALRALEAPTASGGRQARRGALSPLALGAASRSAQAESTQPASTQPASTQLSGQAEDPNAPITAVFGRPVSRNPPRPAEPAPAAKSASAPASSSATSSAPRPAPERRAVYRPPAPQPSAQAPAQRAARRPAAESIDDQNMRRLYDRYIDARRRNNERVDNVRYETVVKSLRQMVPKLKKKHGPDKQVDFDVVVKDGRVGFRPVVKKQ